MLLVPPQSLVQLRPRILCGNSSRDGIQTFLMKVRKQVLDIPCRELKLLIALQTHIVQIKESDR